MPMDVLEELDHRARREEQALVPVEPERVARVADVDLQRGAGDARERARRHRLAAARALHAVQDGAHRKVSGRTPSRASTRSAAATPRYWASSKSENPLASECAKCTRPACASTRRRASPHTKPGRGRTIA